MIICRPWITVRGKRIYASAYGRKAFCWEVDDDKSDKDKSGKDDSSGPGDPPKTIN